MADRFGRCEADYAAVVMAHLTDAGWDCYPEAQLFSGDRRADIAAVMGNRLWIIEVKTNATLALLDQAYGWLGFAHFVSVATPTWMGRKAFSQFLHQNGIGHIGVCAADRTVAVHESPRFNRRPIMAKNFIEALHPDMKRYAPGGTAVSGYSSPWKRTMQMAVDHISANPGATMREIVEGIDHHYSADATARSALMTWLERDKRVMIVRGGSPYRFYPAAAEA